MSREFLATLIFYAVFTGGYALINWAIYAQAVAVLEPGRGGRLLLGLFFLVMVLGPLILHQTGQGTSWAALIVYTWMGVAFYLLLASGVTLGVQLLGLKALLRPLALVLLIATVVLTSYGFWQARSPRMRFQIIPTTSLPAGQKNLDIAVISDLHLFSVEAETRLARVCKVLERLEYDLLLSVGDLIEVGADSAQLAPLARRLAQVDPPLGKYAVFGNHEYYADQAHGPGFSEEFYRAAGFRLLRGETTQAGEAIQLVGLDDFHNPSARREAAESDLLDQVDPDRFVLLLRHQPLINPASVGRFDLQVSGHTHGGQLWPFGLIIKLAYSPYLKGLYELGSGSRLYVTVGAGTWGPPIRIGAPAEVTLIRLVRAESEK